MVLTSAVAVAGSPLQDAEIAQLNKSAVAIAKGDVLTLDAADDNFKTAPAGGVATRYAVAIFAATAAATKVVAAVKGHVTVVADGAIAPGNPVKVSGATAGQVVEAGTPAAVADINAILGYYAGKANNNERDGLSLAACVDGDVIVINLNGGQAK